ncbi:MAG: hypothetical protein J7J03_00795 [Methanosarcinales archaeon]|nr:hypothetical protein [Methanosarcinales archaeon]
MPRTSSNTATMLPTTVKSASCVDRLRACSTAPANRNHTMNGAISPMAMSVAAAPKRWGIIAAEMAGMVAATSRAITLRSSAHHNISWTLKSRSGC